MQAFFEMCGQQHIITLVLKEHSKKMLKILSLIIAIITIGTGFMVTQFLTQIPELPQLDMQEWWGMGSKPKDEDKSIRPFKVDFSDTMIDDLKQRLRNRRPFTKPLESIQSEYGVNTKFLNSVLDYWVEKYNFKKRMDLMNELPRFKTRIQGLDIQYIRMKPTDMQNVPVLPLLMLHGWPTSSKEFEKVIVELMKQKSHNFTFEIIAPDLPGFGFSEGTNKPGLGLLQIGIIMRNLMRRLGFNQFYIQAGDWGSIIGMDICTIFPDEVLGFHTNIAASLRPISIFKMFIIGPMFPSFITEPNLKERIYPLTKILKFWSRELGYFYVFATKPDTIGVSLTDSPAGLASWIIEKIAVSTNRNQLATPHGGLEELQLEDVLDVVTIMWANNASMTSARIYKEIISTVDLEYLIQRIPTRVPTAAVHFLHEIIYQPDWILADKFLNLVRSQAYQFGGHFAGLHTPQIQVNEILASAEEFLKFHKLNKI